MSEKAEKRTTVERVAELAMKLGGKHLADYGAARSRDYLPGSVGNFAAFQPSMPSTMCLMLV